MVDALYAASEANTTSSEVLTRTIDEARDDLHRMAKVVNDSIEELVTTPASVKASVEELWQQPPAPTPRQPTQYRDAVLGALDRPDRPQALHPTPLDHARANAAVKDRQILLNFDPDHPLMRKTPTRRELIDFIQKAIDKLDPTDGPVIQIKAISSTKSGSPILELNSLEATNWLKDPSRRSAFFEHLGGKVQVKERLYHLVVPFLPTSTKTDDPETLRSIKHESDIPEQSITKLKWIKDPSRRDARQRVAHALLSISSPHVANQVIKDGLYLSQHKYHPRKDRKEPLRCLRCQKWVHYASSCTQLKDTCGSCAHEHRDRECNSFETYYCVNCESPSHRSRDRSCPDFQRRCAELDARSPENTMPYFPTDVPWTQVLLPPKPDGPIRHANPPMPAQTPREYTQCTLGTTQSGQLGINPANRTRQPQPQPQPPPPPAPSHNNDRNANSTRPQTNNPRSRSQSSPTPTPTAAEECPIPEHASPSQTSTPKSTTPAGTPTHATLVHPPQPFPASSPLHKTPQPKSKAPKLVLKSLRPPYSSSNEDQDSPLSPTPSLPGGLPEQSNTNHNAIYQ